MNIKKILFFFSIFFSLFLRAGFALALELHYPSIMGFSVNDTSGFAEYARYFFNVGIILSVLVASMMTAYGGILYLISFIKGKFVNEGKEKVKAGLLGLLIVFCSYLLAYTINPDLVVFKFG